MNNTSTGKIEKRYQGVSRSKTFANIVKKFRLDAKKVFDIGCTYGEFLSHFGPGSVGLTIIHEEAEYGKSVGLDIRQGNIESADFTLEERFDVIFANNIFEHMQSPHPFLIRLKEYLKEDGVLILGVPCVPMLTFLMRFRKFRGALASLHINFFTKETLFQSVRAAGWNVSDVRGFHFSIPLLDRCLDPMYPHFYVIARAQKDFEYSAKRKLELEGYKK